MEVCSGHDSGEDINLSYGYACLNFGWLSCCWVFFLCGQIYKTFVMFIF